MATAGPNLASHNRIFDSLLQLKDAGAITASAAAQVGGSNKILDLGATLPTSNQPVAEVNADVVIDVSAVDVSSTNETYTIHVQGSNSSSFASGIANLASLELNYTPTGGADVVAAVGRHLMRFTNWKNGTLYRYIRLYTVCGGTTPSINYTGFLAKDC